MSRLRGLLPGCCLLVLLVHLGRGEPPAAGPATVDRYLEFRDGSILRLPVIDEPVSLNVVRPEGRIETLTVRWSALQRLALTPERTFEKKRQLLATIQKLGSDQYAVREQAQNELIQMGKEIRPDLRAVQQLFSDLEVRTRLRRLLGGMPKEKGEPSETPAPFDVLHTTETFLCDGGDGIPVHVQGKTYRLSRRDVQSLSARPPERNGFDLPRSGPNVFSRLQPADYPPNCLEEGFETTPDGRKLKIGENIEKLFINKGFTLATSIKTSFVSVNNYNVDGKSKGLSAATHQPLWEGEITIRFCKPGRENQPAGVTHFGLWIAAVVPNGTAMHAFDFHGRELGVVRTTRNGNEFLGVRSQVPIHTLRVVPNLQLDPNYTLDDFIYTPPQTADVAHPERFTTLFADGERVICADVSFEGPQVFLHGLPGGLPDRSRPLAELLKVTAPAKGWQDRPTPPGLFVELRDGSVVFGAAPTAKNALPAFARWPKSLKEPFQQTDEVVGLWSSTFPRLDLPAATKPAAVWDADKRSWQEAAQVTLAPEMVAWTSGGQQQKRPYREVPILWLAQPAAGPTVGSWHLRTVQGEDLVLNSKEPPALTGRLSKELSTVWRGGELKVSAADIVSVFRVPKD